MNFFKAILSATFLIILFSTLMACSPISEQAREVAGVPESLSTDADHGDDYVFRDADTGEILNLEKSNLGPKSIQEKFSYLTGSPIRWTGGVVKWWYNPMGQPAQFNTQDVVNALINSAQKWTQKCNIQFQYQGITQTSVTLSSCDRSSVVGWQPLSGSTIGQTQACFSKSNNVMAFNEMDMALDNLQPYQINSFNTMDAVAVHEFGHAFGLGHTDLSVAVMTPWLTTNNLVMDDIDGCQSLYGAGVVVAPTPAPAPTPEIPPVTQPSPSPLFCQPGKTLSCEARNGQGLKTCNRRGSGYGSCEITSCKAGYKMVRGRCR